MSEGVRISLLALDVSTLRLLLKAAKISIAPCERTLSGKRGIFTWAAVCCRIYYTLGLLAIYSLRLTAYSLFPERFKPFSSAISRKASSAHLLNYNELRCWRWNRWSQAPATSPTCGHRLNSISISQFGVASAPPKNTNIGFCLNKGIERTSDLRASAVRATVFAAKVLPVVVVGVVAAVRSSVARTWIGHDDCWQLGAASDFILTILGQCDDALKTDLITLSL